jgi:hypothetical protein
MSQCHDGMHRQNPKTDKESCHLLLRARECVPADGNLLPGSRGRRRAGTGSQKAPGPGPAS